MRERWRPMKCIRFGIARGEELHQRVVVQVIGVCADKYTIDVNLRALVVIDRKALGRIAIWSQFELFAFSISN